MKKNLRTAAVICRSEVGQTEANLRTMESFAAAAAHHNAHWVCFPELCITGYHVREEIADAAIDIDGPEVKRVIRLAGNHGIGIIAGLAEKNAAGGLCATTIACDASGIIGIYRKVHLGPPEKNLFAAADGIGGVVESDGFCFGIQMCYDAHFPELSTHMAARGADAVFIPHASPGNTASEKHASWMRHLPARAYDNAMFVIAVNPTGDNGCGLSFPGLAMVIAPDGNVLESRLADAEETMLIADLPGTMIDDIRGHRMRYFFPNRRADLYCSCGQSPKGR